MDIKTMFDITKAVVGLSGKLIADARKHRQLKREERELREERERLCCRCGKDAELVGESGYGYCKRCHDAIIESRLKYNSPSR